MLCHSYCTVESILNGLAIVVWAEVYAVYCRRRWICCRRLLRPSNPWSKELSDSVMLRHLTRFYVRRMTICGACIVNMVFAFGCSNYFFCRRSKYISWCKCAAAADDDASIGFLLLLVFFGYNYNEICLLFNWYWAAICRALTQGHKYIHRDGFLRDEMMCWGPLCIVMNRIWASIFPAWRASWHHCIHLSNDCNH